MNAGNILQVGRYGGVSKGIPPWIKTFNSGLLNGDNPPPVTIINRWGTGGLIPLSDIDFNRTDLFIYVTYFMFSLNRSVTTAGNRTHLVSIRRTNSNNTNAVNTNLTVQSTRIPVGSCPYRVDTFYTGAVLKYAIRTDGSTPFLDRIVCGQGISGGIISPAFCGGIGDRGRMQVSGYYETKDKPQ